jgi:ferrochelatase
MKYVGQSDYQHNSAPRIGVLLTNLGTPEAPTAKALRPYLKQFLWDPRVVEVPRPIWWLILNGIILNTRPKRSAEAYRAVWTERGSPLLMHLEDQVAGVEQRLVAQYGDRFIVRGAMRYGAPAIHTVLDEMFAAGMEQLVVLPLYPHYGGPTTGSTYDEVSSALTRRDGYHRCALSARTTTTQDTFKPLARASRHIGKSMVAPTNSCFLIMACPSATSSRATPTTANATKLLV